MESNMFEARRAVFIAERKISENDYVGAKQFVNKAQNLYPKLDGLKQMSIMINVYISASNKINEEGEAECDWYGVLGVDHLADDETVKKQYKKLALLLHPDKNKCKGAEGAFKLVLEAWCLLSDKAKRNAYDQKWKSKEAKTETQKPTNPQKPASTNKTAPVNPSKQRKGGMFWTMCNRCKTPCEFLKDSCLNKAILCPNCGQTFIATKKTPWGNFVVRPSASTSHQKHPQASPKSYSESVKASTFNCVKATNQAQKRSKRGPEETFAAVEMIRKKLRKDVSKFSFHRRCVMP
ncbi:hypothetical protein EUTSA_v10027069mg [Eutrema salsugineum]|uniref:J domain-containing protein n=1 Tax=Eutrema salsugineum TaxID=72664 RepID=V4MQL4_EUTSA|nr:J protein JJJ2 [Eutrema salsugineum]ESQ55413.1 hypothetical protein EUTSA_v10027069mg [Eutrema salsugineum]